MKKIIMGAFIALILFLAILFALAPAKVATSWIVNSVPGLSFGHVDGTMWSMKADSVTYRRVKLDNVSLSTSPISLLFGALNSNLNVDDPNIRLASSLNLSTDNYLAEDTQFVINTDYIADLVQLPIRGLQGKVEGKIEKFHWQQKQLIALTGSGEWANAVIEYSNNNLELGNISFEVAKTENGEGARLDIINNQGVLDLKGFIEVTLDKRFNMKLDTTTSLPANIKNWLLSWGRENNGRIYLEWQGQLP